ncbi:MAG TPA: hypothetical protein VMV96_02115 [Acidimicrobiales bacterium]|nr:hypothetical protein [Acidimicrobiales bacterium]
MNRTGVLKRLSGLVLRGAAVAVLPVTLLSSVGNADTPTYTPITLVAPNVPGVPALPGTGVIAPTYTAAANMGSLTINPVQGIQGTPITISGVGVAPNVPVVLTWSTAQLSWQVSVDPQTVNYMGRSATNFNVILTTVTSDASGNFSFKMNAPVDFGGQHDIYAVVGGVEQAHGAFYTVRTVTVTPKRGPVGTPITVTYTGMGSSLYTAGAALLWDNHYTGEMMANWTRGTASVTIRAAGPVGTHYIQVGDAITDLYMNILQSPVPYANGDTVPFVVTKGIGPIAARLDWPSSVTPTISQKTTLSNAGLDPKSTAVASVSPTSGPVNSKARLSVSGLTATGPLQIVWSSVVGSRVNCSGVCWNFTSTPLATATPVNGAINADVTIPDGLGGWHVIQVLNGTSVEAQVPFYVKVSLVPFKNKAGKVISLGTATANNCAKCTSDQKLAAIAAGNSGTGATSFKQGQEFTISVKGVGWTQMDNTMAVDYDNGYVGYGCGFNSNGYMVIHMFATGAPGIHLIDLYPQMYSWQPSFANAPYGMSPMLSYQRDDPGLALGYQMPAIRLAITVTK